MLQDYADITDMMTRLIRRTHHLHYLWHDEGHEGAHPDCKSFSYDVIGKRDRLSPDGDRCCSCVAKPGWWDENGVPRFAPHHPSLCPDIYAIEVALVLIGCQSCGHEYPVQMSWSMAGEIMKSARYMRDMPGRPSQEELMKSSLSAAVVAGTIHYGDPPCFHDGCTTGATMNCDDLRVLEFWSRNKTDPRWHRALAAWVATEASLPARTDWMRIPELEIWLPDASPECQP